MPNGKGLMDGLGEINAGTGRLSVVITVRRTERLVGGDPVGKEEILRFVVARWLRCLLNR